MIEENKVQDYLTGLTGRVVKVQAKGQETAKGRLLGAGSDFLVIQTLDGGIVYYRLNCLKRVVENAKQPVNQLVELPGSYEQPDNFYSGIESMKDQWVTVNDSCTGRLRLINQDFLVIDTERERVFYQYSHVSSIAELKGGDSGGGEMESGNLQSLHELLGYLKRQWVTVNPGREEAEGVLVEYNGETAVLVRGNEVVYMPIIQIEQILLGDWQNDEEEAPAAKKPIPAEETSAIEEMPVPESAGDEAPVLSEEAEAEDFQRIPVKKRYFDRKAWLENLAKQTAAQLEGRTE